MSLFEQDLTGVANASPTPGDMLQNVCILIPAYQPGPPLLDLIASLRAATITPIVVVNDGSGSDRQWIFEKIESEHRIKVLRHAINLGKGAALKTGFNYILCQYADVEAIVTADADGQHAVADILRIAKRTMENSNSLVMGVREFDSQVPWRSRFGNQLTIRIFNVLLGQRLSDTQTGLRGVPRALATAMLKTPSQGYEFELDMLVTAKHQSYPIVQSSITTIYVDANQSSHFNPLRDSIRIYYVLLRFTGLSVLTALLDNLVFIGSLAFTHSAGQSQVLARGIALLFNYWGARRAVFLTSEPHRRTFTKYLLLVTGSGLVSYAIIVTLVSQLGVRVIVAKLLAETSLFIANFAVQRDFVFVKKTIASEATDWDHYYKSVPPTARLTRRYTTSALLSAFRRHVAEHISNPTVTELGGANSCFLQANIRSIAPAAYHVVDNNEYGLSLLRPQADASDGRTSIVLHLENALDLKFRGESDVVFSVGLIEHFTPEQTRQLIATHFDLVKPGGLVVITFPTPTWLYRGARALVESLGMWKFPDERPLKRDEVLPVFQERGTILDERVLWPLVLTQRMLVARKSA